MFTKKRKISITKKAALIAFLAVVSDSGIFENASAAPSCIQSLKINSSAVAAQSSSVVLDFDGDGISDIVSNLDKNQKTIFNIIKSSDNSTATVELPRGKAVPADYDGDSKWDPAVVRKSSNATLWTIVLSSTGQTINQKLGGAKSSVLSGCRFLSSSKYSLATFDNRKLKAIEVGSSQNKKIVFTQLERGNPIGCADTSGDGVDELFVGSKKPNSEQQTVSTVSCINDNIDYGIASPGKNLFVLNPINSEIPAVGRDKVNNGSRKSVRITQLYDQESTPYPSFTLPIKAGYSFGVFKTLENTLQLGILWKTPGSATVYLQLFSTPKEKTEVATLDSKSELVKSQTVIDNADL